MNRLVCTSALARCLALGAAVAGIGAAAAQAASGQFEFSGSQRTRYESLDPQFRSGYSNSDRALALQTTLVFDWHRGDFQVFGEIMDSRVEGNDAGSFTNIATTNTLEPNQAYFAWHHAGSTLRIGRVSQDLGKRRLVARNRYRNTVWSMTGLDWAWSGDDGRALRAFYWIPMLIQPTDTASVLDNDQELDRGTRDSSISGLFYQFPAFAHEHRLETYVFDFELAAKNEPLLAADHVSVGARAYRAPRPGEWNYEVEAVAQRGHSGGMVAGVARRDLDHRASFLHAEIGYAFASPWSPNLILLYDHASGDEDPNDARIDRFNTLLGARRFDLGPTGIYGIAARSNLDSPGVRLTFQPAERWQAMLSYRSLRLAAERDGWIGSGWRDTSGAAGNSIGRHLEGSFTWGAIPNRLVVETGFAQLWAGRFAEQTAGSQFRGDPRYFYSALTVTF